MYSSIVGFVTRMGGGLLRACALGSALLFLYFAAKVFLDGYHTLLAG